MYLKKLLHLVLLLVLIILSGCGTIENMTVHSINNRFFNDPEESDSKNLFVNTDQDTVKVYRVEGSNILNEIEYKEVESFPMLLYGSDNLPRRTFVKGSFNLNFITLPLKFRPAVKDVSPQLNCDFNGSLFAGFSRHRYNIDYSEHSKNIFARRINNWEFSYGVFLGIGNTLVSPTTTEYATEDEYEGAVLQKGVAMYLGYNCFIAGVAVGADNLLGKDRSIWVYENRPYIALTLGFHIN